MYNQTILFRPPDQYIPREYLKNHTPVEVLQHTCFITDIPTIFKFSDYPIRILKISHDSISEQEIYRFKAHLRKCTPAHACIRTPAFPVT